jgi:hypothetical protein
MLHALLYTLKRFVAWFLDRQDNVDWDAVRKCEVSAEPVSDKQLKVY